MNEFLIMIGMLLVGITAIVLPIILFCNKKVEVVKENIKRQKAQEEEDHRLFCFLQEKKEEYLTIKDADLDKKIKDFPQAIENEDKEITLERAALTLEKGAREKNRKMAERAKRENEARVARQKKAEEKRLATQKQVEELQAATRQEQDTLFEAIHDRRNHHAQQGRQQHSQYRFDSLTSAYGATQPQQPVQPVRPIQSQGAFAMGHDATAYAAKDTYDNAPAKINQSIENTLRRLEDTLNALDKGGDINEDEFAAMEREFEQMSEEFDNIDRDALTRTVRKKVSDIYDSSSSSESSELSSKSSESTEEIHSY